MAFDPFQVARYPVTVGEWRWFVAGGGCASPDLPWWRAAGYAACRWLGEKLEQGHGGRRPLHWALSDDRLNNPVQPTVGVTAYEVLAYAA